MCSNCSPVCKTPDSQTMSLDREALIQLLPTSRSKITYFYGVEPRTREDLFDLSEQEIKILGEMALAGDVTAGIRLYEYYKYVVNDLALADDAFEVVPRGNGIDDYNVKAMTVTLPNGEPATITFPSKLQYYLQRKQVVELTALSASGNREAAKRLAEYYGNDDNYDGGVANEDLAEMFLKFSEGDDFVLPEIQALDQKFKQGDLVLVRKSFPRKFMLEYMKIFDQ